MQLDKYQASILAFLFERLPIGEDVDSLEFSLLGSFSGKYRAVHSAIENSDQPARIIFNLPRYSRSVFLALSQSQPNEMARLLANLEDYERETGTSLKLGEVVVTPDQMQQGNGVVPFAIILLRTATSIDCGDVPDSHEFNGLKTSFFLAVPLTKDEWNFRKQHGHDALMEEFHSNNKELFFQ